jgi:FkbM family methyltransferase
MSYVSRAQNFEDYRLFRVFSSTTNGRYIDIGAWDPVYHSVSYNFYGAGWRGVNVEPVSLYFSKLQEARPLDKNYQRFVTNKPNQSLLFVVPNSGLSSSSKVNVEDLKIADPYEILEEWVDPISLNELFNQLSGEVIHWLKIDVEGAENEVLVSWEDNPARPLIVVVEATKPSSQQISDQSWEPELFSRGYLKAYFDGLNNYYCLKGHEEIRELVANPISVFDDVVKYEDYLLKETFQRALEIQGAVSSNGIDEFLGQPQFEKFAYSVSSLINLNVELSKNSEKLSEQNLSLEVETQKLREDLSSLINLNVELSKNSEKLSEQNLSLEVETQKLREDLSSLLNLKIFKYTKILRRCWYLIRKIQAKKILISMLKRIASIILKKRTLKYLVFNLIPSPVLLRFKNLILNQQVDSVKFVKSSPDEMPDPGLDRLIKLFGGIAN